MKKRAGPSAGIPRASGERSSPGVNGAAGKEVRGHPVRPVYLLLSFFLRFSIRLLVTCRSHTLPKKSPLHLFPLLYQPVPAPISIPKFQSGSASVRLQVRASHMFSCRWTCFSTCVWEEMGRENLDPLALRFGGVQLSRCPGVQCQGQRRLNIPLSPSHPPHPNSTMRHFGGSGGFPHLSGNTQPFPVLPRYAAQLSGTTFFFRPQFPLLAAKINEVVTCVWLTFFLCQDDNDDYCASCGGNGDLVCCDGCTRSFHFKCVDPPMDEDQGSLPKEWFCNICQSSKRPGDFPERDGSFALLLERLDRKNPSAYRLPGDVREYFDGVKTGPDGEYEELVAAAKTSR